MYGQIRKYRLVKDDLYQRFQFRKESNGNKNNHEILFHDSLRKNYKNQYILQQLLHFKISKYSYLY